MGVIDTRKSLSDYLTDVYGSPISSCDDSGPEEPYDDSKDHDPCKSCNVGGKNPDAGWYVPFMGPRIKCDDCDGAGWV